MKLNPIQPDWDGMCRNMRREGTPSRVFYFEHGIADNVLRLLAQRFALWDDIPAEGMTVDLRHRVAVHRFLGHELFRIFPPGGRVSVPRREGGWSEEAVGAVSSWSDVESFPWPSADAADLSVMDHLEEMRPDNMRAFHVIDIWEVVRDLMGFEQFCFALYEDRALVSAVFEKVGSFAVKIMERLCEFETFGAVYLADDLGYKTGLMIDPDSIRRLIMPWHRRLADVAKRNGKFLLFHSCGQMYSLLDAYIDDIGIDAKHSFEDVIMPVTEAKKTYGGRLALLGGMDVDFLARATPAAIRAKTREILDVCHPGGGYFLGSGNWVTHYVPVENYLAMLGEAQRYG